MSISEEENIFKDDDEYQFLSRVNFKRLFNVQNRRFSWGRNNNTDLCLKL